MLSSASAIRCAELCQKAYLPPSSFHVSNCNEASVVIGRVASQISPLTLAASTLRANPSLMDLAMSIEVVPSAYSLTEPSGSVIFIMGAKVRRFTIVDLRLSITYQVIAYGGL